GRFPAGEPRGGHRLHRQGQAALAAASRRGGAMTCCRAARLLFLLGTCITLLSPPVAAQGLVFGGKNDRRPTDIVADNGIEWRQNEQVYIARGNAHATRGNATVYADTLIAHYRPAARSPSTAAASKTGGPESS